MDLQSILAHSAKPWQVFDSSRMAIVEKARGFQMNDSQITVIQSRQLSSQDQNKSTPPSGIGRWQNGSKLSFHLRCAHRMHEATISTRKMHVACNPKPDPGKSKKCLRRQRQGYSAKSQIYTWNTDE